MIRTLKRPYTPQQTQQRRPAPVLAETEISDPGTSSLDHLNEVWGLLDIPSSSGDPPPDEFGDATLQSSSWLATATPSEILSTNGMDLLQGMMAMPSSAYTQWNWNDFA